MNSLTYILLNLTFCRLLDESNSEVKVLGIKEDIIMKITFDKPSYPILFAQNTRMQCRNS